MFTPVRRRAPLMPTVRDFSNETIERIRGQNRLENIEVIDLSLEDIFKDFIRGQRSEPCL